MSTLSYKQQAGKGRDFSCTKYSDRFNLHIGETAFVAGCVSWILSPCPLHKILARMGRRSLLMLGMWQRIFCLLEGLTPKVYQIILAINVPHWSKPTDHHWCAIPNKQLLSLNNDRELVYPTFHWQNLQHTKCSSFYAMEDWKYKIINLNDCSQTISMADSLLPLKG